MDRGLSDDDERATEDPRSFARRAHNREKLRKRLRERSIPAYIRRMTTDKYTLPVTEQTVETVLCLEPCDSKARANAFCKNFDFDYNDSDDAPTRADVSAWAYSIAREFALSDGAEETVAHQFGLRFETFTLTSKLADRAAAYVATKMALDAK